MDLSPDLLLFEQRGLTPRKALGALWSEPRKDTMCRRGASLQALEAFRGALFVSENALILTGVKFNIIPTPTLSLTLTATGLTTTNFVLLIVK